MKKEQEKELITSRIFQLKVTISAGFEIMSYKYKSDHQISYLAIVIYIVSPISVNMATNGYNEKKIIWFTEQTRKSTTPDTETRRKINTPDTDTVFNSHISMA